MKAGLRFTTCLVAVVALSGCQSFVNSLGFGPRQSAQTGQLAEVFGSQELERGREALKAGHVMQAIEQFRMAAVNEQYAPDAFNGLGVAYARLGRADLAERYFRTAVELDSNNPKFAANLARFYETPLGASALAMREREAAATLAKAEQAAQAEQLAAAEAVAPRSPVTVERPAVQVARGSNREVRVAAAPVATAPTAVRPASKSPVLLVGRSENPVPEAQGAKGTVRISVSRGGAGRWTARPKAAAYPVRVALKRGD
ncbi:MAG: tetratricopeptide repeat protein [Erythrobacter sp.]